jgi:serine/threonine protein kinase
MTTPAEKSTPSQPSEERTPSSFSPELTKSLPTLTTGDAPPMPKALATPQFPGYDIVRELGRGGMGVVYQAFDSKRRLPVALKTMQGIDSAALLRFKNEFRCLAGLNHANLVTLYELHADDLHWFFTMELIEGVSFLHYVRGSPAGSSLPTLPPDVQPEVTTDLSGSTRLSHEGLQRLRHALAQLAAGVCFLHESGMLHRDIKPSNVLVTAQGRVVLLDFGLAAAIDHDQQHHSINLLGTVAYMAPEQAACQPVSPASDWYAVGVMLYEALTGTLPFHGSAYEILHQKQHLDPPAPSVVAAELPEDLSTLCMELLRRDPQMRPPGSEVLLRLTEHTPALRSGVPFTNATRQQSDGAAQRLEVALIGRQQHLQLLSQALEKTRSGRTVLVEMHGHSGAGKSALMQRFLNDHREDAETVILMGRCYEQESVPYKALDSLIDALSRYLGRLPQAETQALWPRDLAALTRVFPVLRSLDAGGGPRRAPDMSDPHEVRRRALAALRELLARLGDRRTLILAIDDVQWGDEDSAALLTELLRPPDPPVLLLALCYRDEDVQRSPCLRTLNKIRELGGLERFDLPVEPLTPEERRELAVALLDPHDDTAAEQVESIARQSGGYPFFIYELVQCLSALDKRKTVGWVERSETPRRNVLGLATLDPPLGFSAGDLSLSEVLWTRIVALPDEARRLLEIVAVAGQPLTQADACRAADIADEHTVLACLRAGRLIRSTAASLLSQRGEEGSAIETYHDRIRETVLLHLEEQTLQRHHQRLVWVLQESGRADPEVLAVYLVGAGQRSQAGHYYALAAAQAAETLAFDRAAKLYQFALELLAPHGVEKRRLQTKLADALANAGRGAESARAYLSATSGTDASENLELQRKAALQFLRSGHIDDGLATLRTVLAAVGLKLLPSPRRAFWALVWQRLRLMLRGLRFRPSPADRINPAELMRLDICQSAAIGLSMVDTLQGAYFQTRSSLLALKLGEQERLVTALAMEAAHNSVGGSRSRRLTQRYLDAVDNLAQQVNLPYSQAMASLAHGIAAALMGDWRDGQRRSDEAESIYRDSCIGALWERGTAHRFALWPIMLMGDVVEINRRLPRLIQEARQRDDLYEETNLCLVIRTFVRLAADEPKRARSELAQVMEKWSQQGFHVQHMNRLFDEAQIDLYEGDAERAWHRLAESWPTLQQSYLLYVQQVRIIMLDLRARCALARASGEDSVSWLRLAQRDVRALRREKVPWADALAQLREAAIVFRRRDAARAAEFLQAAIAGFSATDMHLHVAVARRRLGQMLDNSQGQAMVQQAEEWMNEQTIRNPARMTDLLAPGWREDDRA